MSRSWILPIISTVDPSAWRRDDHASSSHLHANSNLNGLVLIPQRRALHVKRELHAFVIPGPRQRTIFVYNCFLSSRPPLIGTTSAERITQGRAFFFFFAVSVNGLHSSPPPSSAAVGPSVPLPPGVPCCDALVVDSAFSSLAC
jgi:hypothetical protein